MELVCHGEAEVLAVSEEEPFKWEFLKVKGPG